MHIVDCEDNLLYLSCFYLVLSFSVRKHLALYLVLSFLVHLVFYSTSLLELQKIILHEPTVTYKVSYAHVLPLICSCISCFSCSCKYLIVSVLSL